MVKLLRDPGSAGGGGSGSATATPAAPASASPSPAGGAAASPAPASAGAPGSAPAAPGGGGGQGPGQGAPAGAPAAAAPAAAPFKSALEGLPQRGTPEYMKAFNELPRERQTAIEAEVLDREMNPKKYEDLDKQKSPDPAAAPAGDDEALGWTEEQLNALDPHTQKSIRAMQGIIDQVKDYVQDGKLKDGMQVLVNDPVVKARMAELSNAQDPYAIPEELEAKFDPAAYITKDELASIDLQLKPAESRQTLASALEKAYNAGAKNMAMRAEYEKSGAVAMERRIGLFNQQLGKLMESNPSLKSDKPFNDPSHPLHEYVVWAGENLGDDFLEQHGQEVGHAAFLAAKGRLQETMKNVAKNTQMAFIRAIEAGDKKVAMMPRGGQAQAPQAPDPALGGVDPAKYLSDPTYRRTAFQGASPEVRRKLEILSSTGKLG